LALSPPTWERSRAVAEADNDISLGENAVSIVVFAGGLDTAQQESELRQEASGWFLGTGLARQRRTRCCKAFIGRVDVRLYGEQGGYRGLAEGWEAVVVGDNKLAIVFADPALDDDVVFEQLVSGLEFR
jgi:hypothetical protein